jgi:hypothetical protein
MNRAKNRPAAACSNDTSLGAGTQSLLSLLIFCHLFCVLVALSGSLMPSALQSRLLRLFSPYTQLLNFDLNYTPMHLTQGTLEDVDHQLEVLPAGQDENDGSAWIALPEAGPRHGERYQRYERLAAAMALSADRDTAGLLARSVAGNVWHQDGVKLQQVRCRKHLLQGMDAVSGGTPEQRDPASALYFREAYRVNVIVTSDGQVEVVRAEKTSQVARPDVKQGGR